MRAMLAGHEQPVMPIIVLGIMCLVMTQPQVLGATTRIVPTTYMTIQAAVDAAASGDTIWLEPGTYTGPGNRDIDLLGKPLTVTSIHRDSTIIDCQASGRGMTIHSAMAPPTVLSNLTIKNAEVSEGFGQGVSISNSTVRISDVRIQDCGHDWGYDGGGMEITGSNVRILDTIFAGNHTPGGCGGNLAIGGSTIHMERCQILNGWTLTEAGGICLRGGVDILIIDCYFAYNSSSNSCCGGAIGSEGSVNDVDIFNSTFTNNLSAQGACVGASVDSLVNCVFEDNQGLTRFSDGLAIYGDGNYIANNIFTNNGTSCVEDGSLLSGDFGEIRDNLFVQSSCWGVPVIEGSANLLRYNTFVFGTLEPNSHFVLTDTTVASNNIYYDLSNGSTMFDGPPGFARISCSDIYSPSGIIGPAFVDDGRNFFGDPLFCDYGAGDFSLSSISPCLSASCGQIGAFGHGCWDPMPGVVEVSDVGNDQGRQARLKWLRSEYDAPGAPAQITGYSVYRREGAYLTAPENALELDGEHGEEPALLAGWDHLGWVPAYGDSLYQMVVPTLCDSTATAGICWSAFLVRASTPDPFTYFDSPPDSGYSTDDLSPGAPQNVLAAYNTGYGNELSWDVAPEPDLHHYNVYRGLIPGFDVQDGELIGQPGTAQFTDPSYDGWPVHYMVTAVDHAGNESPASAPGGEPTSTQLTPSRLTLHQNRPNPFNPITWIDFSLPEAGIVQLSIYNVAGRRVRTLVSGTLAQGPQSVQWDGRNEAGAIVGSGVYFYRLETEAGLLVRSMTLLK